MSNDVDELWQLNERLEEVVEEKSTRTPAQRMRDKLRKRKEREAARQSAIQLQRDRDAAELATRRRVLQEASGLISLFESAPGKPCTCYEAQLRTARMFGARLGPTAMAGETAKHFIVRLMRSWGPRGCPLLSVERHELLDSDHQRVYQLTGLDANEYNCFEALDKLIEQFEASCSPEYDQPIDPTTLPPVWRGDV